MCTKGSVKIEDVTAYVAAMDIFPLPMGESSQSICRSIHIDPDDADARFLINTLSHLIKGRIDLIFLKNGEEITAQVASHSARPILQMLLQTDQWSWSDLAGVITENERIWLEKTLPVMKVLTWAGKLNVPLVYL